MRRVVADRPRRDTRCSAGTGAVREMEGEATVGVGGVVSTMLPQLPQTRSSGVRRAPQFRQFIASSKHHCETGLLPAELLLVETGETRFLN
jgi:hypothetical protein